MVTSQELKTLQEFATPPLEIKILRLKPNVEEKYQGDNSNTPWLHDVLKEYHDEEAEKELGSNVNLSLNYSLLKKSNDELETYLLVQGNLKSTFTQKCIRCLIPIIGEFDIALKACFLNTKFQKEPGFEDQLTIYTDHDEYDLYYYDEPNFKIQDYIIEQIQLNTETFPLHDQDCKGLCQDCGHNLNESSCVHNSKVDQFVFDHKKGFISINNLSTH